MKITHTSGPWEVDLHDKAVVIDKNGKDIAVMSISAGMKNNSIKSLDESVLYANARLIASAPEMYHALQYANVCYGRLLRKHSPDTYKKIKLAIDKANGKS